MNKIEGNIASIPVDCQKGFGDKIVDELYVQDGEQIITHVNRTMQEVINLGGINIASKDWHKKGNISFAGNFIGKKSITEVGPNDPRAFVTYDEVKNWTEDNNGLGANAGFTLDELKAKLSIIKVQVLWPDHCVAKTSGAEFMTAIDDSLIKHIVYKGDADLEHPYSAFPGVELTTRKTIEDILDENKVELVKVTGLATDYCVCDTAIDLANTNKYEVQLILEATRAVAEKTKIEAIERMNAAGVKIIRN